MSNQHQIKDASICDECSFTSKIKKGLKWHKERIHGDTAKPAEIIFCDQCKYKINEKRNLSSHIIGIHMGAEYSCDKCLFQANGKIVWRDTSCPYTMYKVYFLLINSFLKFEFPHYREAYGIRILLWKLWFSRKMEK